jgi:hypothetical protein
MRLSDRDGFFTISTDIVQILSGELQSEQTLVPAQGVLRTRRFALMETARLQNRFRASSISFTILFDPANYDGLFGTEEHRADSIASSVEII